MRTEKINLWDKVPGSANYIPNIVGYFPDNKKTDGGVLIIPGSAYLKSPVYAPQEGERVAKYLCNKGITAFVLEYRVYPDCFPLPILDGRRAMRYIRYYSERFKIAKDKICALGYSSGGHLTASLCCFHDKIDYEDIDLIDKENYIPDFQALSYPVISLDVNKYYTHKLSNKSLLNGKYDNLIKKLSFDEGDTKRAPKTFLWHNFDDDGVNVVNTLRYAENLRKNNIPTEIHIFPHGGHGIGLPDSDDKVSVHDKIWIDLFIRWLQYNDF